MFWKSVNKVTAEDAKAIIEGEGAMVIDVRRPIDFKKSHVKGAVSSDRLEVLEQVEGVDKSRPIICYCYRGFSSQAACRILMKAGFTQVLNLKGGYAAWKKAWGKER